MNTFLVYLSGEFVDLAYEEVKASLEAEKVDFTEKEKSNQIFIFESDSNPKKAIERCAYIHSLIQLILKGEIKDNNLNLSIVSRIDLEKDKTIKVRVKKIGHPKTTLSSMDMEKQLASQIFSLYRENDFDVDLENADYTFRGYLYRYNIYLGLELVNTQKKAFSIRDPGNRPSFLPGAMKTDFARALVNLARVKKGDIFYDPFCGGGGLIIEASLLGAYPLGSDLDYRAIHSSVDNMNSLTESYYSLFFSDSRSLAVKKVDVISTDPPYSIQSSTHGEDITELIYNFLINAKSVLKHKSYLVFCLPKKYCPEAIVNKAGYQIKTIIDTRIHKSLTRRILVLVNESD